VTEIAPFQILDAFTNARILCSMGMGPDGNSDSTGTPYGLHIAPSLTQFLADLVEEAEDHHGGQSVVIEWQTLPKTGEDGHVVGHYTIREHNHQREGA
jgi:hypothetical protein